MKKTITNSIFEKESSRRAFIKMATVASGSVIIPAKSFSAKENKLSGIQTEPGYRKLKDIVIYKDSMFYSSFPSVIKKPDGELLLAFRRAPDRTIFGESGTGHIDPNSYLMAVRSTDGENWTKEPELLYAHPFGGSQDPCLLQLKDGTILCTSYGWAIVRKDGLPNLKKPYLHAGWGTFLGGYVLRSVDGGSNWQKPVYPPHVEQEIYYNAYGKAVPAYNRGALCEGKDGRIFWAVAVHDKKNKTSVHLLISKDKGVTWDYSCPIAVDDKISFNETSIYETPKGDLVAFLRTSGLDDQACIARSTDGGKTFDPWHSMKFQGHPLNALCLPDNRVLLTYGFRHKPYGIRARVLNADCSDFFSAAEIILRDDAVNSDIGYTWPVQLDEKRVLVIYYFNMDNNTRHIAGTILSME